MSGNTTAQALDRFESDVMPLLPGMLLAQFGFNDAYVPEWSVLPRLSVGEFCRNLHEFHRVTCARGGGCLFIVNHETAQVLDRQGNGKDFSENLAPYLEAVRHVALTVGALTIDLPALMRVQGVEGQHFLNEDGLHLTTQGNHCYADMVFARLHEFDAAGWLT